MRVTVPVHVWVLVDGAGVPMRMLVDEVDLKQEVALSEHGVWRPVSDDGVLLGQDDHAAARLLGG